MQTREDLVSGLNNASNLMKKIIELQNKRKNIQYRYRSNIKLMEPLKKWMLIIIFTASLKVVQSMIASRTLPFGEIFVFALCIFISKKFNNKKMLV